MSQAIDSEELSFKTEAEVNSWARWYLRANPLDAEGEFQSEEEYLDFANRRSLRLRVQLDDLKNLDFRSPQKCDVDDSYYRIVRKGLDPLTSEGSSLKNSRFNYKDLDVLRNRVVYFGQDKLCCFTEIFHLSIQTLIYEDSEREGVDEADEIDVGEWDLYEFRVKVPNVLVLTSDSTYKALKVDGGAVKNEWFSVNNDFAIPTSGQILARIIRKQGFGGILYRSVRNQIKNNLVVFEDVTGPLDCKHTLQQSFDPRKFAMSLSDKS